MGAIGIMGKDDRNPNVKFLLPNGSEFLNETEKIAGVALKTTKLGMFVTFTDGVPASSPKEKPETKTASIKKMSGATKVDESATAPTATATSSVAATSETDDWFQAMANVADGNEQEWKKNKELDRKKTWHYKGDFRPDDGEGGLDDADLRYDLAAGSMLPKDLIDGIIAYNKKDEKKIEADRKPLTISVKDRTVTFKDAQIKAADVQAYFNAREFVEITPWFADNYGVDGIMKFALNRTSNKPLTLDIRYCFEKDIEKNLPGILAKISKDKNANGLNLTIRFTSQDD